MMLINEVSWINLNNSDCSICQFDSLTYVLGVHLVGKFWGEASFAPIVKVDEDKENEENGANDSVDAEDHDGT